jgi:hypothetical protein
MNKIDEMWKRFLSLFNLCNTENPNQGQVKFLTDDFNYIYKKSNVEEQGEYHGRVSDFMQESQGENNE